MPLVLHDRCDSYDHIHPKNGQGADFKTIKSSESRYKYCSENLRGLILRCFAILKISFSVKMGLVVLHQWAQSRQFVLANSLSCNSCIKRSNFLGILFLSFLKYFLFSSNASFDFLGNSFKIRSIKLGILIRLDFYTKVNHDSN